MAGKLLNRHPKTLAERRLGNSTGYQFQTKESVLAGRRGGRIAPFLSKLKQFLSRQLAAGWGYRASAQGFTFRIKGGCDQRQFIFPYRSTQQQNSNLPQKGLGNFGVLALCHCGSDLVGDQSGSQLDAREISVGHLFANFFSVGHPSPFAGVEFLPTPAPVPDRLNTP